MRERRHKLLSIDNETFTNMINEAIDADGFDECNLPIKPTSEMIDVKWNWDSMSLEILLYDDSFHVVPHSGRPSMIGLINHLDT